jgi:hypothetical protein
MDKSNIEKEELEKKITEDLLEVTNVFGELILNISENIKTNTNYYYNTGDAGDDDSIINGFVINSIILILSTANIFLPLYNKQPSLLLHISGGRDASLLLENRINDSEDFVRKSATKSASASATKSVGIGEYSNINKVIFTKEEVKEKQKLYKIFRKNCKIHFNSDYTQYYNATIFYRKLVYKNSIENLYALLYFYINYNKLKQENVQRGGKNGGMKQKGGLTLPLCKPTSPSIDNSKLGPVKQLYPTLYPNFIPTLKTEMETFLGQGLLTLQSVGEFSSIFQEDLDKDVSDINRAKTDLTKICLQHIPGYNKMKDVDLIALLSNPAAIITGQDFLKPDNYRLVVNNYSIHDTTPSGLKAQIEAWRLDDKLLIIPNISGVLDSAEHSNGGIYDAYNIVKHSEVFKKQLKHIINPAIKALKSFYISLDEINIEININDNNEIVLIVNKVGKSNDGIVVKFGSKGISTVQGVVLRLTTTDLDYLLQYLQDNGLTTQQATDISLFIKHMGDSLQFIQALYHNTEFKDQSDIEKQKECNTFNDDNGNKITINTQNETAFLSCDRSAFNAARALNCNAVIGVGDTKCNSDKIYDKIYWRVSPLIAGLTKIGALVKFFTFCVPYPGPSAQAASMASQASSQSAFGSLSFSGTPVTPMTPPTYTGNSSSSSSSSEGDTPMTPPTYTGNSPSSSLLSEGDTPIGTASSQSSRKSASSSSRKSASSSSRKSASSSSEMNASSSSEMNASSSSRKSASNSSEMSSLGGRKSSLGGRKSSLGGRKSSLGGTIGDSQMSTSDSTKHIVANSSGLLYSPEKVGGKTHTTIYLCFTDENGEINKIFFICTFEDLDLSDQKTITPETAKDFQKIITTIFESSLIELDSQKYDEMFKKMEIDIAKVEAYSSEFEAAFDRNTITLESLSKQFNGSRRINKGNQIINSAIASYKASFSTSLINLQEIKKMVDGWRLKMSVKFSNRKNAIEDFMKKVKEKYGQGPYNHIIESTLVSCRKSLSTVNDIIQKFETFNIKQAEFTRARVKASESILGNSDTQNTSSIGTLMSKVNSSVNDFIRNFEKTIEKLREKEIDKIKQRSEKNIINTDKQIKEKVKELENNNNKLKQLQTKLKELSVRIKGIKKSNIPYTKKEASNDIANIEGLKTAIIAIRTSIKNKTKEIKKLERSLKLYETILLTPHKYANISFKQFTTDALKELQMNITDHTNNLMYLFEVENPVRNMIISRPSYNNNKRSNDTTKGENKQPLPVILDEGSSGISVSEKQGEGSSLKKSKKGGKLLNIKVRIHKATSTKRIL